ncbi:hypothetical protein [Rhizobium sp. BK251]|uniref:hypothetical protein n=1 Tax=Rhizobium sp. BK251 TaxID=2512125 RepID=UPI0010442215|nr:hypothetical protein [Rhizobium sp. BK251]TCL64601.1 hypothetical protein EV286_11422 [Rhizobium sp. BK251]
MKFNDTAPVTAPAGGPPPWLEKLAEDATLEATVLKYPVVGRENIRALLSHAIRLYEFQDFTYKGDFGDQFFMESYRSSIRGVPIECLVVVHMNALGEADSLVINHRPLDAALLFSALMWEAVGDRFGDLYVTIPQLAAMEEAK